MMLGTELGMTQLIVASITFSKLHNYLMLLHPSSILTMELLVSGSFAIPEGP